jgi:hypothetical protein
MSGKSKAPVVVVRGYARWRGGERRYIGEHIRSPSPRHGKGKSRQQLDFFGLLQEAPDKAAHKKRNKRKPIAAKNKAKTKTGKRVGKTVAKRTAKRTVKRIAKRAAKIVSASIKNAKTGKAKTRR